MKSVRPSFEELFADAEQTAEYWRERARIEYAEVIALEAERDAALDRAKKIEKNFWRRGKEIDAAHGKERHRLEARLDAALGALRKIRECMGGDHPSAGWENPEDVWGIAEAALAATGEGKPEGGAALIAAERKRQITEEGWTLEHDRQWWASELARAAATYAIPPSLRLYPLEMGRDPYVPPSWPWAREWWKPGGRIRELTKAGALIAAEIDRLAATEEGK